MYLFRQFLVVAMVLAGNTAVALAAPPLHCFDSMKNVDEDDVDCGGSCPPCAGSDDDGDGISNTDESAAGMNPNDADSDDDGALDGNEDGFDSDFDGDGLINGLDSDRDNDGLYDGTELGLGCDAPGTDGSRNHCLADADMGATTTSPSDADSDNGGVADGSEDTNRNGQIDPGEIDPNNGADDSVQTDTDGDGLSDPLEFALGTDPNDRDSDDDGVQDGNEANFADDTDGNGKINALDPDSDGDAIFDGTERGVACDDPATDAAAGQCRADADSGATTTFPLVADTDGGGRSDGAEDANRNGGIDSGETDPTLGHGADDMAAPASPTPTATATATATVPVVASGCPASPTSGCRVGRHGALIVHNSRKSNEGELEWRFEKGPILTASDFGDPQTTTSYVACVYDDGALVGETEVGPSAALWRRVGRDRGFHYENKNARGGEVAELRLVGRVEGGSMVSLESNLRIDPAAPEAIFNARSEIRIQLLVDGSGCFESSFSGKSIRWNEPHRARGLF